MRSRSLVLLFLLPQLSFAGANRVPVSKLLDQMIHRSTLAEPGSRPFYLKATITDKDDAKSEFNGTVEEYWVSPTKWRRVIKLRDFSQTRIVNGDAIYEDNNGDYFPLHDEMLAKEIVDPLPKAAVDLMNKLELMGAEPGSGAGQCMAEKYFNGTDGREARVLLAYDCKTGLLIYLWSPTCCYGVMADYRKFHGKMVAYATKDDPINIRIDTLRDLDAAQDALFAIDQPTPPDKRITTEKLSETEIRMFLAAKAEIQWPTVSKKPNGNSMSVEIVIGRDGRVKEEDKTKFIRGRFHYSTLTVFNDLQVFGEKTVARKLTILGGDVNKMEITIESLEPATNVNDGLFSISGVKPLYTSGEENQRFTQPRAVYTVKPSIPGWHGMVTCAVKIDEHGHVRDVDVKGTTDESVVKRIRAALMNWEYEPATINGHPSLGFVQVNVE